MILQRRGWQNQMWLSNFYLVRFLRSFWSMKWEWREWFWGMIWNGWIISLDYREWDEIEFWAVTDSHEQLWTSPMGFHQLNPDKRSHFQNDKNFPTFEQDNVYPTARTDLIKKLIKSLRSFSISFVCLTVVFVNKFVCAIKLSNSLLDLTIESSVRYFTRLFFFHSR